MKVSLAKIIFTFMDEFFLAEAAGKEFLPSSKCIRDRWSICESCEHFDEIEEGCRYCGCYLPARIRDQWGDCPLDKWISNSEEWEAKYYEYCKNIIIDKYPEMEECLNES